MCNRQMLRKLRYLTPELLQNVFIKLTEVQSNGTSYRVGLLLQFHLVWVFFLSHSCCLKDKKSHVSLFTFSCTIF